MFGLGLVGRVTAVRARRVQVRNGKARRLWLGAARSGAARRGKAGRLRRGKAGGAG